MDDLTVAVDEQVAVKFRNGTTVRVTSLMYESIQRLREELKQVARRNGTLTYTEACAVMDAYNPQSLGRLLDILSIDCERRNEPSLAALVVRKDVGEVGSAFVGDAAAERQACYEYWTRN